MKETYYGQNISWSTPKSESFKVSVDGHDYSLEEFNDLGIILQNINLDDNQKRVKDEILNYPGDNFEAIREIENIFDDEMLGYGVTKDFDWDGVSETSKAVGTLNIESMAQVLLTVGLQKLKDLKDGKY